jgi:tRNA nucleotidyltransferase (CCA-adding enzyme)
MARRTQLYPQVTPTAADLVDGVVLTVPPGLAARDALRLARRRNADVVAAGPGVFALREDAVRAEALGVADLPVRRLARPLPVVGAREREVTIRRRLAAGAPAVVVTQGRVPLGVVRHGVTPAVVSIRPRLQRWLDAESLALLATVGRLAEAHGARAYAVGGLVRDVWLERARVPRDLDVVVEGDAPIVARALADTLRGTLVEHARFLTASVALGDGRSVDLVTARSERYAGGGALPRVMPASIVEDLRRRDFAVNAMAVELASGAFGLLDPLGGRADVERRRLRILHPLSFVEDPTRIFRAARYAARLGFVLDAWSLRARALALERVPYPALSPARLVAELNLILADAEPGRALGALARAGAFRLLDPRLRATRALVARLHAVPATLAWAGTQGLGVTGVELIAVALSAESSSDVAGGVRRALGLTGAPLERVRAAVEHAAALRSRLTAGTVSDGAGAVREAGPTALAWLHLTGDVVAREALGRVLERIARARSELGGEGVIALGVARGPDVAAVLAALRNARLDGEIHDRQGEIDYVREWLQHRKKEG